MKKRVIALLLCAVMLVTCMGVGVDVFSDDTVTITVNYVYEKNSAMVAQPWSAEIAKGETLNKTVNIPNVENYYYGIEETVLPEGVAIENGKVVFTDFAPSSDFELNIFYKPGQAEYKVRHWQQNLADDEYTMVSETVLTGDIDAYTNAVASDEYLTGFTCAGVEQKYIAADGNTVVDIYYDRNYYKVVFDVNGGVNAPDPIYAKYGADITINKVPTRKGYTFVGWSTIKDGAAVNVPAAVSENVTYYACWEASGSANFTIVYWGENANDTEYSYLGSQAATAKPGTVVNGDASGTYICGEKEHTHSEACYGCGLVNHQHSKDCYPGVGSKVGILATNKAQDKYSDPQNGQIGLISWLVVGDTYYIYIDGIWYAYSGSNKREYYIEKTACGKPEHNHLQSGCTYNCGEIEHTHNSSCRLTFANSTATNTKYYEYSNSDTVTVDASGDTVLNVYYNRVKYNIAFKAERKAVYNINEKWGADISNHWPIKGTNGKTYNNGERWDPSGSSIYNQVLVFIAQMPAESFTLTVDESSNSQYTMNYYGEVISGSGQKSYQNKQFDLLFSVKAKYNFITESEDFFDIQGFDKWKSDPEFSDGKAKPSDKVMDMYYTRKSYNLYFHNGDNDKPEKTEVVKYQENLGAYYYEPTNKPSGVESDALFAGWYQNPQCTGDKYELDKHKMGDGDISLYAKWVNRSYTVETYLDDSFEELYTYSGYSGSQKVEKYKTGNAPTDPTKEGEVFIGWFYKDNNGTEKAFDFSMPVTKDYKLYPKFSDKVMVNYVIHYYIEGTTTKVASDTTGTTMIGSTVTVRSKMGTELDLAESGKQYFPLTTSAAVKVISNGQEIFLYYKEATDMKYTVRYLEKDTGRVLHDPVEKTTNLSIVTEKYVPIEDYTPEYMQLTLELTADAEKNVITFYYTPNTTSLTITKAAKAGTTIDPDQTFVFKVVGKNGKAAGVTTQVVIKGAGSVTINDLPVGEYTVTEITSWSWRYTPDQASQDVTLGFNADNNEITFSNELTNNKWLSFAELVRNIFGTPKNK